MNTDKFDNVNTAIVAVTRQGAALAGRLQVMLPGSCVFLPQKFADSTNNEIITYNLPVRNVIKNIFNHYRYLVLIMATGSAVRLIAPEIQDKRHDPGVVSIDDAGSFCISLLSGHLGGANKLAGQISVLLGAQPVITTSSDINQTISPDILGGEFGWELEDVAPLKAVSAALVNGESVGILQEAGEHDWWLENKPFPENITIYHDLTSLQKARCQAALLITDRVISAEDMSALPVNTLIYRPKSIVAGIGCNRGISSHAIEEAVTKVLTDNGISPRCLKTLSTIDIKKDECGLLKFARERSLPIEYHTREILRTTQFPSPPSSMAMRHVGTPSVCEAAALLSSQSPRLLAKKFSYRRAVTVALAREEQINHSSLCNGKLFLIGTGPGDTRQLTFAAREAIQQSTIILGYKTYVNQIQPLLTGKRVIATGMGDEIQRVKQALNLASEGNTVALISGGDCGIYGMAGPAGEIIRENPELDVSVTVIPGIPALVAAASLLGSPISGDFVSISLSDYLVSWEEIRRRVELAAQGSFVITLYNPRSHQRQHQLAEAIGIIRRYRLAATPVGIVTNAYREGQAVTVTTLENLLDKPVDMNTIIIIGNDETFIDNNRMVTPRGYHTKYSLAEAI